MNLVVESKRENKLLGRTEIVFRVKTNAPVKRSELKTRIAAELGVDEKLIIIDKILPITGSSDMEAFVKIYKDEEYLNKIEPKYKIERNKVVEENGNEGQAESQV
jgi:ribosomal protein S24E